MKSLDELFSEFAAAGAAYALELNRHMRASFAVGTAAHRGAGTMVYREAERAQIEVDYTANQLDRTGRLLVEELLKHLEGDVSVGHYLFGPNGVGGIVRTKFGAPSVIYLPDEEKEHSAQTPTPTDWLELMVAFPAIQQALKAPAA